MQSDIEPRRNNSSWLVLLLVLAISIQCHGGIFSKDKYKIEDGRHNISMGTRNTSHPKDVLLFHDQPERKGSFLPWPKVLTYDVCYPPTKGINSPKNITITAFNVTDRVPKGKGGYAFIVSGGVGFDSLCLHFQSQRGKGYNFDINVYGYYK